MKDPSFLTLKEARIRNLTSLSLKCIPILVNADKSLENLNKSASLEWVPAMERLGSDYLNGNGVKKNPNQGKK